MTSFEESHTFIVRIWREPRTEMAVHALCRGMVEHVISHERGYFSTFAELIDFVDQRLTCPDLHGSPHSLNAIVQRLE